MAQAHHHDHPAPRPGTHTTAFAIGTTLNFAFVVVEVFFGVFGHSLALVADAGHNLGDVLGLAVAWGAASLARRRPTARRTYGWHSSSILAALGNASALLITTGAIAWEAIRRFQHPEPVSGGTVILVAGAGVLINAVSAFLFRKGGERDVNVKAAYVHLAADALLSLGVVIAGAVIHFTGWLWMDPAVSLVLAVAIVVGTWSLLRESLDLALHAVPARIDPAQVRDFLSQAPGVAEVHDLHIWAISTSDAALTAHLVIPSALRRDTLLRELSDELREHFGINHATLQVEEQGLEGCCALESEVPA